MPEHKTFNGFFSYAHKDAETDPVMVKAFTEQLEKIVSNNLVNADFKIWRDTNNLRTGDKWDEKIGDAVRNAHVFIILLSPKWIESEYCRKEHSIFADEVEPRVIGEYIFAIMARDIGNQAKHFNDEQQTAYEYLQQRQYQKILTRDFAKLASKQRNSLLEEMAEDVAGMIERLRSLPDATEADGETKTANRSKRSFTFNRQPYNFRDVDIIDEAEVVVDDGAAGENQIVFAQCSFIKHLYVQSDGVRVEFGVQRCFISLRDGGGNNLQRVELDRPSSGPDVRYVPLRDAPDALTLSVTAAPGNSLGDLSLPPAEGQNRLAKIATLPKDCQPAMLSAELSVSLCPDGLWISGENAARPTPRTQKKIAAILNAAVQKQEQMDGSGKLKRTIPIENKGGQS